MDSVSYSAEPMKHMRTHKFIIAATLAAVLIAGSGALAQSTSSAPAPASNEIVNYVGQLPTPSELSRTPAPAGARIAKISQSSGEIAVTYVYENGQTRVMTYRLLSTANGQAPAGMPSATTMTSPASDPAPATPPAAATIVQPSSPPPPVYYYDAPPAVVYQSAPAVYYGAPYYYPWYPPVSLSLGFGFRGGYYGGFRGGFRR
jgi:hypothetical protein